MRDVTWLLGSSIISGSCIQLGCKLCTVLEPYLHIQECKLEPVASSIRYILLQPWKVLTASTLLELSQHHSLGLVLGWHGLLVCPLYSLEQALVVAVACKICTVLLGSKYDFFLFASTIHKHVIHALDMI